jgi:NADH-quinone oxidoreductase subunit N
MLAILPVVVLVGAGIVIVTLEILRQRSSWVVATDLASIGVLMAMLLVYSKGLIETTAFSGTLRLDSWGAFSGALALLGVLVGTLLSTRFFGQRRSDPSIHSSLALFAGAGMVLAVFSVELIMLFISVELFSLMLYVLVASDREHRTSTEAGLKYLILGAVGAAFLFYGMALLYGSQGTTFFAADALTGAASGARLLSLGLVLAAAGLSFKFALVPFHMWAPDVYQGGPTPVVSIVATSSKVVSFAVAFRLFWAYSPESLSSLHVLFGVLAVLSITLGTVSALVQNNLKRLLGYSGISHAGYLALAFLCTKELGGAALLFYLAAYAVSTAAAFGVIATLERRTGRETTIQSISGVGHKRPWYGAALAISFLSLAGIPPTAGFAAKFFLFSATLEAQQTELTIFAILMSAVGLAVYLRPLVSAFMKPAESDFEGRESTREVVAVGLVSVLTVLWGILPSWLYSLATRAASSLQ